MTAQILNGTRVAEQIQQSLQKKVNERLEKGLRAPSLAVILVGNDPASTIYVKNKRKACQATGITSYAYDLPQNTTEQALVALIHDLNENTDIDGILIQLPLPKHIDTNKLIETISPIKDVDGFHPYNLGRLAQQNPFIRSCTPYGVMKLLAFYDLNPKGLHAVVVGASNIVGRPMSLELLMAGSTVTICHRSTKDLARHVSCADLLVVAIGKMGVVQSEWIKEGSIIVDVGMHRSETGKLCGDLDFTAASQKASWITPVPGGVGPMTIASLLSNTFFCAEHFYDI